jgi:hypothetical protein
VNYSGNEWHRILYLGGHRKEIGFACACDLFRRLCPTSHRQQQRPRVWWCCLGQRAAGQTWLLLGARGAELPRKHAPNISLGRPSSLCKCVMLCCFDYVVLRVRWALDSSLVDSIDLNDGDAKLTLRFWTQEFDIKLNQILLLTAY